MGFSNPTRYGRYEIVGPLATGGMADLLLARSSGPDGFESLAVVKRILPHLALSPEFVRMFLGEARLAAQLRHQNIVHVYDAGQERGQYYFVMEYVHGHDLRAILRLAASRKRRLGFDEAISIAVGLCAGLHHAHERRGGDGQPLGIVHRDVSPSNVLVSFDGAVKLADFGIAKATRAVGEAGTNNLRGKASYMSPEQCLGQPLDRRSDLYSLSVVLYELTTGERPHPEAESEFLTLKQTIEAPARKPSTLRADYPTELEQIVLAGLSRDREQRPGSAREIQLALEEFARRQQLAISQLTVARLVEELFGGELHAWEAAQRSGKALSQHLTETGTVSIDRIAEARTVPLAGPAERSSAGVQEQIAAPREPLQRRWIGRVAAFVAATVAAAGIAFAISSREITVGNAPATAPASLPPTVATTAAPTAAPAPALLDPHVPPDDPGLASTEHSLVRTPSPGVTRPVGHTRVHKTPGNRHPPSTRWNPEAPVLPH
jgi:serine/threonine protein kinase